MQPPERPEQGGDVQVRTFLIADVRGYTLFTQERGDEAGAKLAGKFADIARETVEARNGTLLELRGDEALCVFASSREAIRAAIDLQRRFVAETLDDPELPLTVGIGLDAGEAIPVQGGYRGGALNLAARLCGQAKAGEVLATREVTHLARRLDGLRYEDRGSLTFKGITDPVTVVRVLPEDGDPAQLLRPFAPARPAPPKRPRRWPVAVAALVAGALVALAIPLVESDDAPSVEIGSNSIARLDGSGAASVAAPLGERPGATAFGLRSLWVVQPDRDSVVRIDPADGSVEDRIQVGSAPADIAVGGGSVWVSNAAGSSISRIADTGEVIDEIPAGASPTSIAYGDGALWIADGVAGSLLRLDPDSQEVDSLTLPGQPTDVTFTPDGVWVALTPTSIALVDPDTFELTLEQPVGGGPTAILAAFDSIWVANHLDGTVSRLDPTTGTVRATVEVGEGPNSLAAVEGSVWVANEFDRTVASIDPATDDLSSTIPVGGSAVSLAVQGADLWLAVGASADQHRGGHLVLAQSQSPLETLDPAVVYEVETWRILVTTNNGLLSYKKVGGPEGTTLVPDLATALPEVSSDGLTYRFVLRSGVEYSNGEPVRPEDFRRGIERMLVLHDNPYFFAAIEGAEACIGADDCDLSGSVRTDATSVTFTLARPDPALPFKLALPMAFPVPADTPADDQFTDPLPATGPYMIVEAGEDSVRLERNPHFQEWSGAAQPAGSLAGMTFLFGVEPAEAYDELEAGEVDVMLDTPLAEDLESLRTEHPDRVASWPAANSVFIGFDVQRPPFDDARVRQAVAYAIDRRHILELLGGPVTNRLACQILPPTFQGYSPYCPFTLDPETNVWTAPDVQRARALIRDSGFTGDPISVLAARSGLFPGAADVMRYVTGVLNDLGLEAELDILPKGEAYFGRLFGTPAGTSAHPQAFIMGWFSDYPGASDFIIPQFRCPPEGGANVSGYCDEELDERMDATLELSLTDPVAADRAWTQIEHELVDAAVQVPIAYLVFNYAVTERVGNVQVHPHWGLLPGLLWIE